MVHSVSKVAIQWTLDYPDLDYPDLDYPDLDYPDPRLSGSRTEIIARSYNDLRMRVVAVDKKIIVYMAAKSVVLSTRLSTTQLHSWLALFTAAGSSRPVHSNW